MKKVVINAGKIYLEKSDPSANAILINDDCFEAIGDRDDFLSEIRKGADIIDAGNNIVLPGFIDAHNHFSMMGMQHFEINLEGLHDKQDICNKLSEAANHIDPDHPLIANSYEFDCIHPFNRLTKDDLDRVVPGRLIQVTERSGHLSVTNQYSLERAGIPLADAGCQCPSQPTRFTGEICGKANSRLFHFFQSHINTPQNLKLAWKEAAESAVSRGVTGIHMLCTEEDLALICEYQSCLPIHLRIYTETKNIEMVKEAGLKQIGGCGRVLVDGDTGPFTAAFFTPYRDRPETKGCLYYSDEELDDYVWQAHSAGLQIGLHCVGEAASHQLMNAIENAQTRDGKKLRHRIEHFEFADNDMKDRAKMLGICLSIQPAFNHFWPHKSYIDSLGELRASKADPINSLAERDIPLCFGSDSTVTPCDPLLTIHSAVNHSNAAERISAAKAIAYHTIGGAYCGCEEAIYGSITPGKSADLVILEADPAEVAPQVIKDIPVLQTISSGQLVYSA